MNKMEELIKQISESIKLISDQIVIIAKNSSGGLWASMFVALSAFAGAYSALQSRKTVMEMKNARLDEYRPILHIKSIRQKQSRRIILLSNEGKGPLFSLKFDFRDDALTKTSLQVKEEQECVIKMSYSNINKLNNMKHVVFTYKDVYGRIFESKCSVYIKAEPLNELVIEPDLMHKQLF